MARCKLLKTKRSDAYPQRETLARGRSGQDITQSRMGAWMCDPSRGKRTCIQQRCFA